MNPAETTEQSLLMPRRKPRSVVISLSYRVKRLATFIFGRERTMRFFLTASWLCWRFAFELSSEFYQEKFLMNAKGLSEDLLLSWIPENGSVIDIGCSNGFWSRIAAKKAATVVGIDYMPDLIETARALTTENNVEFIAGDATKVLGDRVFDIAILSHVIEHIDNSDAFLQKLLPIASHLVIEVPDFENDPLNWSRLKNKTPFYSDADHVREYTEKILIDQVERSGWHVLENKKNGGSLIVLAEKQS
jgi:SAM-dependent methyltransferase